MRERGDAAQECRPRHMEPFANHSQTSGRAFGSHRRSCSVTQRGQREVVQTMCSWCRTDRERLEPAPAGRLSWCRQSVPKEPGKGASWGEGRGSVGLWGAAPYAAQQPGLQRKPSLEDPALHPGPLLLVAAVVSEGAGRRHSDLGRWASPRTAGPRQSNVWTLEPDSRGSSPRSGPCCLLGKSLTPITPVPPFLQLQSEGLRGSQQDPAGRVRRLVGTE